MNISISSILITLFISTLLIISLNYFMENTNKLKIFRTDFLFILISITILRLILPVELFFTITIMFTPVMNPIYEFLNFELLTGITNLHILLSIWLCGSIIYTVHFAHQIFLSYRITNRLQKSSIPYKTKELSEPYKSKYKIFITDLVDSPMVFGLRKLIFLPNISFPDDDLLNIIHHEIQHIKNHDVYIKLFLNILIILYWWFPPTYILKKNVCLFLEVRVDDQVTRNMTTESRLKYTRSLINVQKKIKTHHQFKAFAYSSFIDDSSYILSYRIQYLIDGEFLRKTRSQYLLLLLFIPLLTNLVILEPGYPNSNLTNGTYSIEEINEEAYITHKRDGRYIFTLNGESVEYGYTIPDELKNVQIVEESEIKP